MILDNVRLRAEPYFLEATCPKHKCDMVKLDNGWFSVCWYCPKCDYPYELKMTKMRNVKRENLEKALLERKNKLTKK